MLTIKVSGLDKLNRDLQTVNSALSSLKGEIAKLQFDPADEVSIRAAVKTMERAVDRKIRPYRHNPMVATIAVNMKAIYAKAIKQRARELREM